jgi:regulator of cell morphogenesis and NO signaling
MPKSEAVHECCATESAEARWLGRPLADLVAHILQRYHAPLPAELSRLLELSERVVARHGGKDGRLAGVATCLRRLSEELLQHMHKEEIVLFPWILSGRGRTAGGPIAVMQLEHEETGSLLSELGRLTDEFTAPAQACSSWRALCTGLGELAADLREHMALESNVLFPGVLAGPSEER